MSRKPEAECHLDGLRRGMPGLTAAAGGVLAEAAAVCLERQSHSAGVVLSIRRAYKKDIPLTWDRTTAQQRRTHNDIQEATESGACGVAILLIERLARMVVIQRSRKGTYFDYWIGRASPGSTLFQDSVRLEVSGILTGDEKKLDARVGQKLAQVKKAKKRLPSYVAVVEFGSPMAKVARINAKVVRK